MAYKRVLLPVGVDENGNPVKRQIGGNNDGERFLRGLQAAIDSGMLNQFLQLQPNIPQKPERELHPLNTYMQAWFVRYKGHLKKDSKGTQLKWLKDACVFFGDEPIEHIDADRIQDYINSMQHLTTDTIKKKINFLSQMFDIAVEKELVKKNPTKSSSIKYGGQEGKGITALPKEKVRELVDKIRNSPDKNIALWLALPLYAGLRREEVLGLRWEDIDFDTGFLHVERSVTYPSSHPDLGPPKTKGSERNVPIGDELQAILLKYRQSKGYLIADEQGELFIEYKINTLRDSVREYTGIPRLDARQLRHTYASMLHASGVETRAVGACLGHTRTDTTDRYIQVEPARLGEIKNQMMNYVLS